MEKTHFHNEPTSHGDKTQKGKQDISNLEHDLKKIDSGFTFISFISFGQVLIVGSVKEYIGAPSKTENAIKDLNFTAIIPENFKEKFQNFQIKNKFYTPTDDPMTCSITRIKIDEVLEQKYIPIHLSCNKFSMAVLLKNVNKVERLKEELKDYKDFFQEFKSCLSAKQLSFQSYFMNNITNEILYKDTDKNFSNSSMQTCFVSENDFKERVTDLISGEKYVNVMNKMFEKLQNLGIIQGGRVDIYQIYQNLFEIDELYCTKLVIIGDFAKNWFKNWNDYEYKKNWKNLYEKYLLFELPYAGLPIKQVEMGENHILILTIDGEIYSCGDGTNGATGNGNRNFHSLPARIKFPHDGIIINRIAAGGRHSLAIDIGNMTYSWGCGQNGRLGHGNDRDVFQPRVIDMLSTSKIKQVDAGDTYSAAVSYDGMLYTWGHGEFGRLGFEENNNELTPKRVEFFGTNVISVKCGYYCTFVYTKKDTKIEIFVLGEKTTSYLNNMKKPKEQTTNKPQDNNLPCLIEQDNHFKKIEFTNKSDRSKKYPIIALCGYQYIAVISEEFHKKSKIVPEEEDDEDLVNESFSNNVNGLTTQGKRINPKKEQNANVINLCDIYFSGNINMTINKNGSQFYKLFHQELSYIIYKKKNLQLPLNCSKFIDYFMQLKKLKIGGENTEDTELEAKGKEIKRVECSDNNTAVLSQDGDLYVFGCYLYKIASDEVENYTIPLQPKGTKVINMALGSNHIIIITSNYDVYGAGRNAEGQLGLGKPSSFIDITSAAFIEKLKNKGIKKAYSSENYTLVQSFNNEAFIFGDISFLEKSQFIHHQSSPKKLEWGEIFKIACGPSHILMMARDEKSGHVVMKAIGNGTYGKLGDDAENEDNRFDPVNVEIQLPVSFTELDRKKNVVLRCSRVNSACLVQDPFENEHSKLYVWGLCSKSLFSNPKDLERYAKKFNFHRILPTDNSIPISVPVMINPWNESIRKFALTDSLIYVVTYPRNELKYSGGFYSMKKTGHLKATGEFEKIALGRDHACALSKSKNKIFTWGFNVMNKLGIPSEKEGPTVNTDFSDISKFFKDTAINVTNFNKLFEVRKILNKNPVVAIDEFTNFGKEEVEEDKNEITDFNKDTKIEEINPDLLDNIFSQTQIIIKGDYDNLESLLLANEVKFKELLKNMLMDFNFLVENQKSLQKLKRALFNQFTFKMIDPPMNIQIREQNSTNKFPIEFTKFKRNYKCLLTTLKLHPCYIKKLYEGEYFLNSTKDIYPKELYKIIKQLFFNIYDDKNSQLILITLAKLILECDIKKLIKFSKDENDKKNVLDNYYLFKINDGILEFNLFAKICKLIMKTQLKQSSRQEIVALSVIGNVYSKSGSKGQSGYESAMLIKYHPDIRSKKKADLSETYSHQRNQRIDLIFQVFEHFMETIKKTNSDLEKIKNPLFSFTFNSNPKNENKLFMKLTKISRLLIAEIIATLEKIFKKSESEKIIDWIVRRFPLIIFYKILKMIENPKKSLSVDTGILVDKQTFQTFMNESISNYYSIAYVMRFCFELMGLGDKANEMGDDEVNKQIEKRFAAIKPHLVTAVKQIITMKNKPSTRFDMIQLTEFFNHSLNDRSHRINFSLFDIKRLQEVIVPNIKDIRVLNPDFDFMDFVFFNKKNYPDYFIGNDDGLMNCQIDKEDNLTVQINIKTRLMSYQNPTSIMKCVHCNVIIFHEFVLANEKAYFKEFKFINKSSKEGRFINILKACNQIVIKHDRITDFFKDEISRKESPIYDNLYHLLTLIAVDDKKNYLLEEEDIADPKTLIDITLSQNLTNAKFKEICKRIMEKYDKMKIHRDYQESLWATLDQIRSYSINKDIYVSRNVLYGRIKKNFEKGYGNPDVFANYKNSLKNSSKIVQLEKHYDELPKSKNLLGKLPKEKKAKLLPFRDFELKKLMDNKVILKVLLTNCDADQHPKNYKILIQTTDKSEFVLTLTKVMKPKTGCWSCGKATDLNTKKIHSKTITNDDLKAITTKAMISIKKEEDAYATVEGFLQVDPKEFIKLLKELTSTGLD